MRRIVRWLPSVGLVFVLAACGGSESSPPSIVDMTPAANASDVAIPFVVAVEFDRAMDPASFTNTGLRVTSPQDPADPNSPIITLAGDITVEGTLAEMIPDGDMTSGTTYTVTVTTAVTDTNGNHLDHEAVWVFTTSSGA